MSENAVKVACVGTGLVGQCWAITFARAGHSVRLYDENATTLARAPELIAASLDDLKSYGLVDDPEAILSRISVAATLEEAVADADYVQESVFERVDVKQQVSTAIGALIRDDAIVGSSSSGIPASAFTENAPRRERFLISHPVNPPHLIPVVELVPAPWSAPEIVGWTREFMEAIGQKPVVLSREIEGFVINRLQGALLNEAWALFDAGLASAADIDRAVSEGLGLRWSFMGPFETIDLNAPSGVKDYAERLGPLYHSIAADRRDPQPWSEELIARVAAERRDALPLDQLPDRSGWRDRRLMALAAHRAKQPRG